MESFKEVLITEEFKNLRLDVFLTKNDFASSRAKALRLISSQAVFLKGKALKASYRLRSGDLLKVFLSPDDSHQKDILSPYDYPLEIVFEDEEILVVNKPAGLVVHPAPGHKDKTLVNILSSKKKLSPGSQNLRPGVVHRLDKGASGLLILAKTKRSEQDLIQQFKRQEIQRKYWAIALRAPAPYEDQIETWIGRHPVLRKKFIALKEFRAGSKKAVTFYQLIKQHSSGISWIHCQLKTGRTHQIRVHLSSIGCPLLGDSLYGQKKLSFIKDQGLKKEIQDLDRIALHAYFLQFIHPQSKKTLFFEIPWPEELYFLLKKLKFLDLK
ncbi:MAG: RluA family pseudouridine synthase [Oligoflexia bacterium]|nr:RluA family pseudouridine synthase [Oligoflexia bacterium]